MRDAVDILSKSSNCHSIDVDVPTSMTVSAENAIPPRILQIEISNLRHKLEYTKIPINVLCMLL